jgi:hypothetical protein
MSHRAILLGRSYLRFLPSSVFPSSDALIFVFMTNLYISRVRGAGVRDVILLPVAHGLQGTNSDSWHICALCRNSAPLTVYGDLWVRFLPASAI